jgi:hypothetical protein
MMLLTFKCDIPGCEAAHTETQPGEGAAGWGEVRGFALNGKDNPTLCPRHLGVLAEFMDTVMSLEIKK